MPVQQQWGERRSRRPAAALVAAIWLPSPDDAPVTRMVFVLLLMLFVLSVGLLNSSVLLLE
jgi:hypothetical protein